MNNKFVFCTLAMSRKYCSFAKKLAADLEKYAPGTILVVCTDFPDEFKNFTNVRAFKHSQKGIFFCNNDKRFAIEKALSIVDTVIFIDADTRITASVPENIAFLPGITPDMYLNIAEAENNKARTKELEVIKKLIAKLGLSIKQVNWISPDLFVIKREDGKEIEFLKEWDRIARYLQLRGFNYRYLHQDENTIGLAASQVGLTVRNEGLETLRNIKKHQFVVSSSTEPNTLLYKLYKLLFWKLKRGIGSPYRLSREMLIALKDLKFYFR